MTQDGHIREESAALDSDAVSVREMVVEASVCWQQCQGGRSSKLGVWY
jgi:hypothetical protein